MYLHHNLIPRVAYFVLPLESKQEVTSGWNLTKYISEVKVNQLKVKNTHGEMGTCPFKIHIKSNYCHKFEIKLLLIIPTQSRKNWKESKVHSHGGQWKGIVKFTHSSLWMRQLWEWSIILDVTLFLTNFSGTEELKSNSGWVPLLLSLMFEYTNNDSLWRPYLDLCPDFNELDQPMFWSRWVCELDLLFLLIKTLCI